MRLFLITCVAAVLTVTAAERGEPLTPITQEAVTRATVALYVEQVLGWEFFNTSSQLWTNGYNEPVTVGGLGKRIASSRTERLATVRAVVLGEEDQDLVMMTLRSYVDPLYPNRFVQGANLPVKSKKRELINLDNPSLRRADWIRYSRLQFTWYEDKGGGALTVSRKVDGMTESDREPPQNYEAWSGTIKEHYLGAEWTRPHEMISVEQHHQFKKLMEHPIAMRFFGEHDVALLYVPKALFSDSGQPLPLTLGLRNPTATTHSLLYRSKQMFGFDFVLVGTDTMQRIREYRPSVADVLPGIFKSSSWVDLVLGIDSVNLLRAIDQALVEHLPAVGGSSIESRVAMATNLDPLVLRAVGKLVLHFLPL